jgi:hypothetical protein
MTSPAEPLPELKPAFDRINLAAFIFASLVVYYKI